MDFNKSVDKVKSLFYTIVRVWNNIENIGTVSINMLVGSCGFCSPCRHVWEKGQTCHGCNSIPVKRRAAVYDCLPCQPVSSSGDGGHTSHRVEITPFNKEETQ
jgi:hypothetical protein